MRGLYLFVLKSLYASGLEETTVRLARYLDQYCHDPLDNSPLYAAIWKFILEVAQQQLCHDDRGNGCGMPVLSADDSYHQPCWDIEAAIIAEEDAWHQENDQQPAEEVDLYAVDSEEPCWGCGHPPSLCKCPLDPEEEIITTQEIYHRALAHFGNEEQAREATEMYPGDFVI